MNTVKELKVSAIENGTVIDHIPASSVFQVIKLLGLENCSEQIFVGTNLESKKFVKKGIVKVSNRYFKDEEVNKIALVAPYASLIVIKDYQVVEKRTIELPDSFEGILKCINPNCITNHEDIMQKYYVINKESSKVTCHYCEKNAEAKNMDFIK